MYETSRKTELQARLLAQNHQFVQQQIQMEKALAHSKKSTTVQRTQQLKENNDQLKDEGGQLQQMQAQVHDQIRRKEEENNSPKHALPFQDGLPLQQEQDVSQRQADSVQINATTDSSSSSLVQSELQPPEHSSRALVQPHPPSKPPPRNWTELKCQRMLKCGLGCYSIAVQGDVVCVGVRAHVVFFSRTSGAQVRGLGLDQIEDMVFCRLDQIEGAVLGVAFIDEDTIVVSADKKLRAYTTNGQLVRTFDSGKAGFNPRGLIAGPNGRIFVCDMGNHCVCVFNVEGKLLSSFGSKGRGVGHFDRPCDVCVGGEGLLFICDKGNGRICVHSSEGAFIRELPTPSMPSCVAATHCNHLVVSSASSNSVMIMTTDGQLVHRFGWLGSDPGLFRGPEGIAVDNDDCVYVGDQLNNRVQVF